MVVDVLKEFLKVHLKSNASQKGSWRENFSKIYVDINDNFLLDKNSGKYW